MTVTDPMRSASTSRRAALTLIDCWALGWRIRQLMRLIRSPIVAVTRRVCGDGGGGPYSCDGFGHDGDAEAGEEEGVDGGGEDFES